MIQLKNICVIPARGGSKRIPRKNIKDFCGKPIIAYSIEAALESKLFDEVMVSTDDDEIAEVAKNYGAQVPFKRSEKNSNDIATTYDLIEEVHSAYALQDKVFENTCCFYATAPFIHKKHLLEANKLLQKNCSAVMTVSPYEYPIQRRLVLENDYVTMVEKKHTKTRSQDLQKNYHDAGQFYFYNTKSYLKNRGVFNMDTLAVVLSPSEVQDIDTPTDWTIAEIKYRLMQKNG